MKIKYKLILLLLLIILIITTSISVLFYYNQKEVLRKQVEKQLESVSEAKERRIHYLFQSRKELVGFPANNYRIVTFMKSYLETGRQADQVKLTEILEKYLKTIPGFNDLFIITPAGETIASTDSKILKKNWSETEIFRFCINGDRYFDSIHFDSKNRYSIMMGAPVKDEKKIIGVLVVSRFADEIISLTNDFTGLGKTGETYLGRKYGDSIVFLNKLRYENVASLKAAIPARSISNSMGLAIYLKRDTLVEAFDYRGIPVLSSLRYFPENGWGMVTEVDLDEAMSPISSLKHKLFIINGLGILMAVIIAYFSGSWFVKPIEELTENSRKLSEGDFSYKTRINSSDEIGVLSNAFNLMADKLGQKIVRSESMFSTVFDSIEQGIIFFKVCRNQENEIVDFEYQLVNPFAGFLLKRNRYELIGKSILTEYPYVKEIGLFDVQVETILTGNSKVVSFTHGYQGVKKWFKTSCLKISDNELLLTFSDITEEKESDIRQENMQSLLMQSQELGKIGSFDYDVVNNVLLWSENLFRIHGYMPDQLTLTTENVIRLVHPEDRDRILKAFTTELSREDFELEYRFLSRDGAIGIAHGKARAVFDSNGRITNLKGFVQDITDRVKILEQLKELNAKLENKVEERTKDLTQSNENLRKLNQSLDRYAYIISHDLKASIASIEGLTEILKEEYQDKLLGPEGVTIVSMVGEKVTVMRNIVDNVLKNVKSEKNIKAPVNLNELVGEVLNTLKPPENFHIFVQDTLPVVSYNKISLLQIIQNLISNSIKYMDKSRPVIKIMAEDKGDFFQICIVDNGQGIPESKLETIFDPFVVAHEDERKDSHGLGLSIVKQLVETHGGKVWATSNLGKETHFYFTIPKSDAVR